MIPYDPLRPDLGQHAWHEEHGFFHGYINGIYYRMVCSPAELEEVRAKESGGKETPLDNDEVWRALDEHDYLDPWDEHYGAFEPASPFEEDLDFEARRRIIAVNMYLDPTTTTWYGLGKQFDALMSFRRQRDRQEVLRHRLLALGLDPRKEQQPETRHLRALALELGLNPFRATWEDVDRTHLELHKVALPQALAQRAAKHLSGKDMNFANLLQRALTSYLDHEEHRSNRTDKRHPPQV